MLLTGILQPFGPEQAKAEVKEGEKKEDGGLPPLPPGPPPPSNESPAPVGNNFYQPNNPGKSIEWTLTKSYVLE